MDNIFLLLLKNSIMASFMAVFILFLFKIGSKHIPPKIRYGLWLLVVLRLIVPFSWESPVSIINLGSGFVLSQAETAVMPAGSYQIITPATNGNDYQEILIENEGTDFSYNDANRSNSSRNIALVSIIAAVWLTGSVLILLAYLLALIRFNRQLAQCPVCTDDNLLTMLEQIKQEMNISCNIPIICNPDANAFSVVSVFRPKLIVPVDVTSKFSPQELEFVLRHELTHYQRHDLLVFNIIALLQALYWFNPLLWYAFHQMRLDCESSCDAEVLKKLRTEQYQTYGLTLVKVIELLPRQGTSIVSLGMGTSYINVKRRVEMIANFKKDQMKKGVLLALIAIIALGTIIFYTDPLSSPVAAKPGLFAIRSEPGFIFYDADNNRLVVPKTEQVKTVQDIQQQDVYWKNTYIFMINGSTQPKRYVVDNELLQDVVVDYSGSMAAITFTGKQLMAFAAEEDKNNFYFMPAKAQEVYKHIAVLDPAHGGADFGAVIEQQQAEEIFASAGTDMIQRYRGQNIMEKDLTLALAQNIESIANRISGNELKIYLTRQNDETVSLDERADIANAIGGIYLNLHYNLAEPNSNNAGTETYYYEETNAECKRLAEILQTKLTRDLGTADRGVKPGNFYMLRTVQGPGVNIEVAFLNHSNDLIKILSKDFTEKTALSVLNGLRQYFDIAGEIAPLPAAITQDRND